MASDKQCEPANYRKFEVLQPERSSYTDGTIGFADNNGGTTGIADKAIDGAGAVDLTGIGLEAVDRPRNSWCPSTGPARIRPRSRCA